MVNKISLNTNMSVFYCCRNLIYINKNIDEVQLIDNNIIPNSIRHLIFGTMSKNNNKELFNELYQDKLENDKKSIVNKVIDFTTKLKVAFKYKIEGKCYCNNKIPWTTDLNTKYISHDDQYNLYVYMFNKDSSLPPIYDPSIYNSYYRNLVDVSLQVMWRFGNK